MLAKVKVPLYVELVPGDTVEYFNYRGEIRQTTIKRVVETKYQTYAVFANNTWRPLSTHGITWIKKDIKVS